MIEGFDSVWGVLEIVSRFPGTSVATARLEPSAAPSSAELQPSCGDLSEPGLELADPGWRWLELSSAVAAEFIPS